VPKSKASKRWDAKNIKVLSVGLRTEEALEVNEAAIEIGLTVKGWLRAVIRKELVKRKTEESDV
jgi:vacuolar-type H+-ATPase subunit C/Vma6